MRKLVIASPAATQSGYGHHAREIISQLIEQRGTEWDVKLVSLPWGHTPFTYPLSNDLKSRIIPLPLTEQPDIWIQVTVPNEFQPVGKFNIGITAGTEGDLCPETWIDNLNAMQLVIVPSEFTKHVFEKTAKEKNKTLTTNIHVVPEYFDETVYTGKYELNLDVLNTIPESWAFLTVGHWLQGSLGEDRKNISGVIYSFYDAYKNQKNQPALVLKTSGATYSVTDRMEIEKKIKQVASIFKKTDRLPKVYLLHGELSDTEMNALYMHPKIKAMYSLTKSEGFGRPLLEFATTSKPIIAPYFSGPVDFLKQDFICEVKGGLTNVHPTAQNDWLIGEAKWFTPDYKYAVDCLRNVQKDYKKWLELAKRQRFFARSNFNKDAVTKIYADIFKQIDTALESAPKPMTLKLPKLQKI
jgi:glycosyltransferase involved in cell wall biosynthesis